MITKPNVKINLGLNVLRKREDGYHDLETLFVPYMEISDTLEIVAGDDYSRTSASLFSRYGSLPERADGAGPLVQAVSDDGKMMITIARREGVDWNPLKDLCAKAYKILSDDFDLPPVKIFLEKTSPVGAGLGGGSSDAAFALRMLDEMFSLGLDDSVLAGYASRLGSDCAFFIYNRPMIGRGRGEILVPYSLEGIGYGQEGSSDMPYEIKVAVPEGIAVSTAQAYGGIIPRIPEHSLTEILANPVSSCKASLVHHAETTASSARPQLSAIKSSLYESGAVYASMSGSGSALFGIYRR